MFAYESRLIKDIQNSRRGKFLEDVIPAFIVFLILSLSCVTINDAYPRMGEDNETSISNIIGSIK